jgi:hypothetical protein
MDSTYSQLEIRMLTLGASLLHTHEQAAQVVAEALAEIIRLREEVRSLRRVKAKPKGRGN